MDEWLSEGVDEFAARVPCLFADIDGNAVVDEPGPYRALHFVNAMIECLAVLHQRSELAMCFGRHVNGFEFIHCSHTGELEGIVFVGFAFDVTPLPSIFIGGADEGFESMADGQVIDPSRGAAGLHNDAVDFVVLEESVEVISFGGSVQKRVLSGFGVEKEAHGIALTEIQSENFQGMRFLGFGGGIL